MSLNSLIGLFFAIILVVCIALISQEPATEGAMGQEEEGLVIDALGLEEELEDAEEQGYALVHWSFGTKEQAEGVYDALRLAAWRVSTAGSYAKVIEPTQPEGSDEWVVGITCEVMRGFDPDEE